MGHYDECRPTREELQGKCECGSHFWDKTDDLRLFVDTLVTSRLQRKFMCILCGEETWKDIPVVYNSKLVETEIEKNKKEAEK